MTMAHYTNMTRGKGPEGTFSYLVQRHYHMGSCGPTGTQLGKWYGGWPAPRYRLNLYLPIKLCEQRRLNRDPRFCRLPLQTHEPTD